MQREKPDRRKRVDAAAGGIQTAANAADEIFEPPEGSGIVGKKRLRIWAAIIRTRARLEWREADLIVAARIVHDTYDLERMRKIIRRANFVAADGVNPHPLMVLTNRLSAEIRSDCRLIGLAAAMVGTANDWKILRAAEREARDKKPGKRDPLALRLIA
jgi:hypothetical protein